jgi:hypothetical protein
MLTYALFTCYYIRSVTAADCKAWGGGRLDSAATERMRRMLTYADVCVRIRPTVYAVSRRLIVKLGGEEDSIAPLRSVFTKEQERVVEELQQQVCSRVERIRQHTAAYGSIRQHTSLRSSCGSSESIRL